MSKPLHCYAFNEETYKLEHVQIDDYAERPWGSSGRITYSFYVRNSKGVKVKRWKESSELDKFVHGQVYTFDLTEDEVKKIIEQTLLEKMTNSIKLYLKAFHKLLDFEEGSSDMAKRKEKIEVIYALDLQGKEFDGPLNFALYDVYKSKDEYVIRYYGCCPVHTSKTLEEAKEYIRQKTPHFKHLM